MGSEWHNKVDDLVQKYGKQWKEIGRELDIDSETVRSYYRGHHIVTGKQIGRAHV